MNSNVKATIFNVAAITNFFAVCLFAAYIITLVGANIATLPIVHMVIAFTAPILGVLFLGFNYLANKEAKNSKFFKKIFEKQQKLLKKEPNDISNTLKTLNCNVKDQKSILPALAYFKVLKNENKEILKKIQAIKDTQTEDPNVKYTLEKQIHYIEENELLKNKLNQARIYYIINNPTCCITLNDIGRIHVLSFATRQAALKVGDDPYFIFHENIKNQKRSLGLTSTQVKELRIENISKLIFD